VRLADPGGPGAQVDGAGQRVTFIGKSMRPRCPRCRQTSRPSARHCTTCGGALLAIVKSAGQASHDHYMRLMMAEPNPEAREAYWRLANPDVYGTGNGGRAS
jgi:hypothetical protein